MTEQHEGKLEPEVIMLLGWTSRPLQLAVGGEVSSGGTAIGFSIGLLSTVRAKLAGGTSNINGHLHSNPRPILGIL